MFVSFTGFKRQGKVPLKVAMSTSTPLINISSLVGAVLLKSLKYWRMGRRSKEKKNCAFGYILSFSFF